MPAFGQNRIWQKNPNLARSFSLSLLLLVGLLVLVGACVCVVVGVVCSRFLGLSLEDARLRIIQFGPTGKLNWPKSKLAEVEKKSWPMSKLAEVDRAHDGVVPSVHEVICEARHS